MTTPSITVPPLTSTAFLSRLLAGILLLNLFVVVLAALWLSHSRQQDMDDAAITTRNLSQILEQYVVGTVRAVDLALLTAADEYAKHDHGIDAQALNRFLAQQLSHLPELESLRVTDAQGIVRYGPGVAPGSGVSVADRDYFIAARDGAQNGLAISKPLLARISKKWAIVLARRLNRPDGSFAGVVYVNLALEHLTKVFSAIDIGPHGVVSLRDAEMALIARHPEIKDAGIDVGSRLVSHELQRLLTAGRTTGTYDTPTGSDNIARTVSFRKIGDYPLYIIVGLAPDDFLVEWHGEVAGVVPLVALFLLMTLFASRFLFVAWKRQAESELQLKTIVETEPECVKILAPDGTLRQMNRAGLDMIEADSEAQVIGANVADIVAPAYRQAFIDLGKRVNQGESGTLEFEIIGLKGGRRWLETHAVPMHDSENRIVGLLGVTRDITQRRQAEAVLKKSELRLREAQRVAQIGSWELNLATQAMNCSEEALLIFELDTGRSDVSFAAFQEVIHPDDRERAALAFAESLKNRRPFDMVYRLLLADGSIKYVQARSEATYDADGIAAGAAGTVQDVTLTVLNEQAMTESEERFRTIADYTYDWEYWQGPQGEFLYISPSCQRVTGYSQAEFISRPTLVYEIIHADDRHLMDAHLADIRHEDEGALDFRIVGKDGGIRWIAHGCRAVYAKDGRFLGRRASNRDITDRKSAEEQVQQLAYFDTLTGLPNRRMLFDRLARALSQAKRFERSLAIMFLDLDNFKKINDTLGHDAGDELLKEVAVRLGTCIRSGDTVARQGGDEFIIVLAEIAAPEDAALVAEKIVKTLIEPVRVAEQALQVTTSIGIAVYPINGTDDVRELLKKADKAMYAAKAAGRNGYRFFPD